MFINAGTLTYCYAGLRMCIFLVCFIPATITMAATADSVPSAQIGDATTTADIAQETTAVKSDTNSQSSSTTIPVASTMAPVTTTKSQAFTQKTNSASQLANLMGGLALILVLIFGLSWFVKRFSQGGFLQNPTMNIVSSMPLGTRERLMLIDVGGKQLLLGVTATQINTLHVFDEPVVVKTEKNSAVNSDFSQKLMAILQQKNMTQSDSASIKNADH